MKFYITNFNPVPVTACLMDPTVGVCLLAPELAGLLHAAKLSKLYVIQQAVKETQPATDNSDSTTASTSWVRAPVLQKFIFLAAKMTKTHVGNTQETSSQEQLDKYMTDLQSYGGTSGKQFWMDSQATTVLRHWRWTCCGHQHQKSMLNASSPSAESLQPEDEIG